MILPGEIFKIIFLYICGSHFSEPTTHIFNKNGVSPLSTNPVKKALHHTFFAASYIFVTQCFVRFGMMMGLIGKGENITLPCFFSSFSVLIQNEKEFVKGEAFSCYALCYTD